MKKLSLLLLSTVIIQLSHAQPDLDSLWSIWKDEMAPDTAKLIAMHEIAWNGYLYSKPDSAFILAQLIVDHSSDEGLEKYLAKALRTQAISLRVRGEFFIALDYCQQSFDISQNTDDKIGMATTLNSMGIVYDYLGDYPKALNCYQRSLKIKEKISDKKGIAQTMNNIGIIYDYQGEYSKALSYYMRSLKIYEELDYDRGIASTLLNIGVANRYLGHYSEAMEYFKQSLVMFEILSNQRAMATTLKNIGNIYIQQGDYDNALGYFRQGLGISEKMDDKSGIAAISFDIGRVYNEIGEHNNAIYWCERSLDLAEMINSVYGSLDACQCLYDAHKGLGNDKESLYYHELLMKLADSLQAKETAKILRHMEYEKMILADSLIKEEEKLKIQITHEAEVRKKSRARNIFIVSAVLLLIGAVALYRRILFVRKAKKAIENEKERSDKLLLNILPNDIAEELKEKGRARPRKFEKVAILFTDFKEFTKISEELIAEELVEEINACFEPFDSICEKYGIEKIKTIGDSYMAAGGLPVPLEDSVKNTVLAAIEMKEFMIIRQQEQNDKEKVSFEMRIGIHTGPVIAGIVGVKKFQYDIWGDTVNIASRIENAGKEGRVNISRATYELIKDDPAFLFQARGMVKIKGKGEMEMWFVEKT